MAGQVSLNENEWDTHVSFTVMSMAASADGKYLLASTDKSRYPFRENAVFFPVCVS